MRATMVTAMTAALLLAAPASAESRNVIPRIEVAPSAEGAVVRISGSRAPTFRQFELARPERLVVDLAGAVLAGPAAEIPADGRTVRAVRTAMFLEGGVSMTRVTIELASPAVWNVSARGHDLVVDLRRTGDAAGEVARAQAPDALLEAQRARDAAEAGLAEARDRVRAETAARAQAEAVATRAAGALAEAEARLQAAEAARVEAERRARDALARAREAEAAAAREALAREEAQARAQREALAREEAQARAQREALAREEAQARAQREALAREEAQARAQREALAREEAQARAQREAVAREEAGSQARREADGHAERLALALTELQARAEALEARARAAELREAELRAAGPVLADAHAGLVPGRRYAQYDPGAGAAELDAGAPRLLELVGFSLLPDVARVFVRTNEAVRYTVEETAEGLVIELANTRAATVNDLNYLDARFFGTPVETVDPQELEGAQAHIRIAIRLSRKVPYEVRQVDNEIQVDFPRGS